MSDNNPNVPGNDQPTDNPLSQVPQAPETAPAAPDAQPAQAFPPATPPAHPVAPPAPPAPEGYTPAPAGPSAPKGLAITALIVGIVAFITGWVPVLGIVIGVIGLVLGIIALVKRQPKALALTGTILSVIAIIASLIFTIIAGMVTSAVVSGLEDGSISLDTTEFEENNSSTSDNSAADSSQTALEACMSMSGPMSEASDAMSGVDASDPQSAVDAYTELAAAFGNFASSVGNPEVKATATDIESDLIAVRDAMQKALVDGDTSAMNEYMDSLTDLQDSYGQLVELCS